MGSIRMAEANQYAEASVFSTKSPVRETEDGGHRRVAHLPLWIVQGLLALIFLRTVHFLEMIGGGEVDIWQLYEPSDFGE